MKKCLAILAVGLLAGRTTDSLAKDTDRFLPHVSTQSAGERLGDMPAGAVPYSYTRAPGDTLCFGYVDGDGFAVPGETWTFDHEAGGSLEGWYDVDVTEQDEIYFRQINETVWNDDVFNVVEAPDFDTQGAAWIGVFGEQARDLCWDGGLGYGNDWCQRLLSPVLTYPGSGNVAVGWRHFNDTENSFDYTSVLFRELPSQVETQLKQYTGQIGLAGDHPASIPDGVVDADVLTSSDFGGTTEYQIVFEMTSDGSWSDEDALFTTAYGPAAFDDVTIGANSYDFESGLGSWTTEGCPGFTSFLGIELLSEYTIEDPCQCELAGYVLEMHRGPADDADHPYGQHMYAVSPAVDALNDVTPGTLGGSGQLAVFVDWDQYSVMPRANGVFYRPGAYYFPFVCELTNAEGWSDRIGQDSFFFVGEDPVCALNRNILTAVDGEQLPVDAEQVRFIFELYASCDAFGIDPDDCTQNTNFTPLIDNIKICFTRVPVAPNISVELGSNLQDGFAQGTLINDPAKTGRADAGRNRNFGNTRPYVLGDSLAISGPVVTSTETRWEANFWFRVARTGPLADAGYDSWVAGVNAGAGVDIEAGEFAGASMDSAQLGTNAFRNKFASYLKEEDWAAWGRGAGPELTDEVEIIPDDVLFPGTSIEYFLTSNFLDTPGEKFYLPDTSGGFFREFEILPSWRDVGEGQYRHPCLLYIDAFNAGAQVIIQAAVDSLGYAIDRYDYVDATSSWKAPMARGGSEADNNGCTLPQLLGYRGILLNSGSINISQLLWPEDFSMFSDWLTAAICDAGTSRQGLIMNGDGISLSLASIGSTLLDKMGAIHIDDWYADFSGNDDTCVRIESRLDVGELYGTENSVSNYDYDAFGNWCPQQSTYDVIGTAGTGTGNRVYLDLDDFSETNFAQVVNELVVPDGGGFTENYRTVLDGVSWHHMAAPENGGADRCVASFTNIQAAAFNEMAAAIEWIYEVDYDEFTSLCEDPCNFPGIPAEIEPGSVGRGITRLFQNAPNPFNPRTAVRFALAVSGPVEVSIYDVGGRKVRTLVQGELEAGSHEVVWDGADDAGRPLSSGVYWTQLTTNGRSFNKKATVLR